MRRRQIGIFRSHERGSALVFFAFFILFLMGAAALAIDLGMLYVARNEAQRSADAAALAGASVFTGTCTLNASCESSASQSTAAQNAVAAAKANYVAGEPGAVDCSLTTGYSSTSCPGIQFTDPTGQGKEPQITVTVQRTGISLIFARMFGMRTGSVSAKATAEAYMGAGVESAVTPFLLPNCDPLQVDANAASSADLNQYCYDPATGNSGTLAYFIHDGKVVNPEIYTGASAGALGMPWTLHYAYNGFTTNASGSVAPSQWSMVSFPDANGNFSNSNSNLVAEIESGPTSGVSIGCGAMLQTVTGNRPVPIDKAVNSLIGAPRQDYLTPPTNGTTDQPYPKSFYGGDFFSITPGGGGGAFAGQLGNSRSIILAPLFNANTLNPGNQTVEVDGFAVLFLDYSVVSKGQETIQANILNLIPCSGPSINGGGNGTVSSDASPIPIRLIQHPN